MSALVRAFPALAVLTVILIGAVLTTGRTNAESAGIVNTTLYPGHNLVGWIETNAPAEQMFDAIPELQSIRSSSPAESWQVRRPDEGDSASGRILRMGNGYWFRIAGDRPVVWQRTVNEQAARRQLRPGRHFIAWAGVDGVTLQHAMLPIGKAADRAMQWDARNQRLLVWYPRALGVMVLKVPQPALRERQPSGAEFASHSLRTGDAIVLTVGRALEWVQPTGRLPEMRFVGEVGEDIRRFVKEDSEFVTRYFARRFGVEADPDRLVIVVPASWADLYGEDESRWPDAGAFARPPSLSRPWQKTEIVIPSTFWTKYPSRHRGGAGWGAIGVLLHEYFHALQFHLALPNMRFVPGWLVEGTAIAVPYEFAPRRDWAKPPERTISAVPLTDHVAWDHKHELGSLAVRRLVLSTDRDAYHEFWRELGTRPQSKGAWREVFAEVFGRTVDEFYVEFEAWMRSYFPRVTGTVASSGSLALDQFKVVTRVDGKAEFEGLVDPDGRFQLIVPAGQEFRITIGRIDSVCSAYVLQNGEQGGYLESVMFSSETVQLEITLEPDFCEHQLRGTLASTNPREIDAVTVKSCDVEKNMCVSTTTNVNGQFNLRVPLPGSYALTFRSPHDVSCFAYYRSGRITRSFEQRALILVPTIMEGHLDVDIGSSLCAIHLGGRLIGLSDRNDLIQSTEDDETNMQLTVQVCPYEGGTCRNARVDAEGWFSTGLSGPGYQEVALHWDPHSNAIGGIGDMCKLNFQRLVNATAEDGATLDWTVPHEFCSLFVSGVMLEQGGNPLSGLRILACSEGSWTQPHRCPAATRTAADGSFKLRMPSNGRFSLVLNRVFQCDSLTWAENFKKFARDVAVAGIDVDLGIWRTSVPTCQ